jgi:hypothetical protein
MNWWAWLVLTVLFITPARAEVSAKDMEGACSSVEFAGGTPRFTGSRFEAGICLGYINASLSFLRLAQLVAERNQLRVPFCIPAAVDADQLRRVVLSNIAAHPERLHWEAMALVFTATQEAFPCTAP